jgi:hypothetical protein
MKNIHLVRTDNQSRIVIVYNDVDRNDFVLKLDTEVNDSYKECVNICITNLERPKVGDWSINLNSPYTHKELCKIDNQIELDEYVNKEGNDCQKVVLTDDEDLIKDGVQSIDDEFLEWFIKNPSCESVEIEEIEKYKSTTYDQPDKFIGYDYKIIIPSEDTIEGKSLINVDSFRELELKIVELEKDFGIPNRVYDLIEEYRLLECGLQISNAIILLDMFIDYIEKHSDVKINREFPLDFVRNNTEMFIDKKKKCNLK